MQPVLQHVRASPVLVRTAPFVIFVALTFLQGRFGEDSRYWCYAAKTIAGAGMLWAVWPAVTEMRWRLSWEAVAAGVGVFLLWVGLDGWYPGLDALWRDYVCPLLRKVGLESWCGQARAADLPWNPHAAFGNNSALAWGFIAVRVLGSTLVVPPLEEVFYRSFLYRYLAKPNFLSIPLGTFLAFPFVAVAVVFGLTHREWLAGILCGLIYQGLVWRKGRLGDAMTAHAITNALLAAWVVGRGAWQFW